MPKYPDILENFYTYSVLNPKFPNPKTLHSSNPKIST